MNNYLQFLAAKMTLDDINQKYLVTEETNKFLKEIEESIKTLKDKGQSKLLPLVMHLDRIQDCVQTQNAVKRIA